MVEFMLFTLIFGGVIIRQGKRDFRQAGRDCVSLGIKVVWVLEIRMNLIKFC